MLRGWCFDVGLFVLRYVGSVGGLDFGGLGVDCGFGIGFDFVVSIDLRIRWKF